MASEEQESPARPMSDRDRLLESAKVLFSIHGFENTSTAAIAKHAHASESQIVTIFGSKEGLLEEIFEQGWRNMEFISHAIQVLPSPFDKLRTMFDLVLQALDKDQALKELMLFEGRRIRKAASGADIMVTSGYLRFSAAVEQVVAGMIPHSPAAGKISPAAMTSALIGMFESMLRDQVLARRVDFHFAPSSDEVRAVFDLFLNRVLEVRSGPADSK